MVLFFLTIKYVIEKYVQRSQLKLMFENREAKHFWHNHKSLICMDEIELH